MENLFEVSNKIILIALQKAVSINTNVSIAVVDTGGHLVAFNRMKNVPFGIIDFAIRKAKTAISFGVDSVVFGTIMESVGASSSGMQYTNGGLVTIGGGVIIKNATGEVIGALGISGGTVEQDMAIAQYVADTFLENINN